jgi:hypothetical protein
MCDLTSLYAFLGTAGGLIAGAIAAIGVAAALNNGFFSAPASPAAMVTAGGLTVAAAAAAGAARGAAEAYFQCMGSPASCAGEYQNLINALAAIITVLGIQGTACFAAAGIAWIPWAGQAPMYAILGALIIQAALIPSIIGFAVALVDCAESAAVASSTGPLIAAAGAGLIAIVFTWYIRRGRKITGTTVRTG